MPDRPPNELSRAKTADCAARMIRHGEPLPMLEGVGQFGAPFDRFKAAAPQLVAHVWLGETQTVSSLRAGRLYGASAARLFGV